MVQVFENIPTVLTTAGAAFEDVIEFVGNFTHDEFA